MERSIVDFRKDEENHWVALLDCGHPQHTRHRPPFELREWTETEEGRQRMLGETLDCLRCDDMEWPEGFVAYKQTRGFTESTVPKGLLNNHNTKRGVWAQIHVLEGKLLYSIEPWQKEALLEPGVVGVVLPQLLHRVEPVGEVRFYVEFYRKESDGEG